MKRERFLFLTILALLVCVYLPLIFSHRMPPGHDTWQYLTMQFDFLNQRIQNGTIPQWLPLMTQGSMANWWFGVQAGFFQFVYLSVGKLIEHFNFLQLFHVGMLFDEFILALGTWLLSKRYFETVEARFFSTIAIVGSSIWMDQVWLNFHSYYTFPILLECLHRFFERRSYKYLFLAANLVAFHAMGGLPYFLPFIALVAVFYFATYGFVKKINLLKPVVDCFKTTDILWIVLSVLSFVYIYLFLKNGMSQVVFSNLGRSVSGGASEFSSFAEAGGNTSLHKFLEMFTGVSSSLNQTMYCGVLVIPLVIIAVTDNLNKSCLHLVIFTLILILMSIGPLSFVSSTSYFAWPGMKFMRYLGLTGSFPKIFLCFIAGYGIDHLVLHPDKRPKLLYLILIFMIALIPFLLAQCALPNKNILGLEFYSRMTLGRVYDDPINLINRCLIMAFFYAMGITVLVSLQDSGKKQGTGMILLLVVHTLDVFSYKSHLNYAKSVDLTSAQYDLFGFKKLEYSPQRISDYRSNERYRILEDVMFKNVLDTNGVMDLPNDRYPPIGQYGALHWCHESFLNIDSIQSPFRTDYWLLPLDQLVRAYWHLGNDENNPGFLTRKFFFPFQNPAVSKMSGYSIPKIQMFDKAYYDKDPERIRALFQQPKYSGDSLVLTGDSPIELRSIDSLFAEPNTNSRTEVPFEVKNFGWDFLQIHLEKPVQRASWLYYSDVWHPFWKATIDGNDSKVWRANLAYKAVQLTPGNQNIEFDFRNPTQNVFNLFELNKCLDVDHYIF